MYMSLGDHPRCAWPHYGIAETLLAMDDPDGARTAALLALKYRTPLGVENEYVRETRGLLDRIHWRLDQDHIPEEATAPGS